MKKILLLLIISFASISSQAQFGSILGAVRKQSAKSKSDQAIFNAQEQIRREDSITSVRAAKARINDSLRRVKNEAIQYSEDSLRRVNARNAAEEAKRMRLLENRPIWEKLEMDTTEFKQTYGSSFEYKLQEANKHESSSGWRVFFLGAKNVYIKNVINFLSEKGWTMDLNETTSITTLKTNKYDNQAGYNAKLNFRFSLDKNKRITGASITGTTNDVIDFYIDYWENHDLNYNNISHKKGIYTINASDKVSFQWVANKPVITITQGLINFELQKRTLKDL